MHHVFVYGTLKRGNVNHDADLLAPCFAGLARSLHAYPLVVAGRWFSPVMFDEPGSGYRVSGELYTVDEDTLEVLDGIEGVGRSGGYHRVTIALERDGGDRVEAWCYVKERGDVSLIHDGPLAEYRDTRYVPRDLRP